MQTNPMHRVIRGSAAPAAALLSAGVLLAAPAAQAATTGSVRSSAPSPSGSLAGGAVRPGPALLYQPLTASPQLSNSGIWRAPPILTSGASAYRDGEYLYQDFLYDDHGANGGAPDPTDKRAGGDTFSRANGTYTYPTDPRYAGNAADLVELRAKPYAGGMAFRLTYNTMNDPSLVASTIAIGSSPTALPVPHGANATAPAQVFVTVHGDQADARQAATRQQLTAPTVSVDRARRQVEVRVPSSDYAFSGQVRLAAATGLWDTAKDRYLLPQLAADATHPGGSGALPAPTAFFNVAFRHQEPMPKIGDLPGTTTNPAWWRDSAQGNALRTGDLSPFSATVDVAKLAAGTTDDMTGQPQGVPTTGPMDRIEVSHEETKQGVDYSTTCGSNDGCTGELRGRLQPYAIYVPATRPASGRYGLTLQLHSLAANYNQYLGSRNESQFGDRAPGSIVITPEGRGPDGWYVGAAGADTFEVWADVAARYPLDPAYTVATGYSMGGYGTYRFTTRFPDLFAKGQPTVGPPGVGVWVPPAPPLPGGQGSLTYPMLASLRNVPFLIWVEKTDQLVPFAGTQTQADGFDKLGYRYAFDAFNQGDHLTLSLNDQYAPAAAFLGSSRVDPNPAHVTYVLNAAMDDPAHAMVANKAYWLSSITQRDPAGPLGTIDVRSLGFGRADPTASATTLGTGVLTGGNLFPITFTSQQKTWAPAAASPRRDALSISARDVRSVTIDPSRARVSCNARLKVATDGPLTVTLAGCGRTQTFG